MHLDLCFYYSCGKNNAYDRSYSRNWNNKKEWYCKPERRAGETVNILHGRTSPVIDAYSCV